MATYTIIKRDGRRFKVTTDDNKRQTVSSGSSRSSDPVVIDRKTGRRSSTATVTQINDNRPEEQVQEVKVPLTSKPEEQTQTLKPIETNVQNNNLQKLQQEQFLQDQRNAPAERVKRNRFDKAIESAIKGQEGQSSFNPSVTAGTKYNLLNIPSFNYNKANQQLKETSVRTAGFIAYSSKGIYEGFKDLFDGKTYYTYKPRPDGTFLKEKSPFSQETKDFYTAGTSYIFGGNKYVNSLGLEDVKRNPLNVLPAVADTSVKVGAIGTAQARLDASRLQVTTTKTGGVISTSSKGGASTFKTKEVGNVKVTLEQPYTGFRVPKRLGGIGNDPIVTQNYYYSLISRGGAFSTDKTFLKQPIARTTSESFLTVKDAKGKTIIDNSLVQQSAGRSTSDLFAQTTKSFNPITGEKTGTVRELGGKSSIRQDGLYSVRQTGITDNKGIGISGFREDFARITEGSRISSGITKAKSIEFKTLAEINKKGSQALVYKTPSVTPSTTLTPEYSVIPAKYSANNLFSVNPSTNIYGGFLSGSRETTTIKPELSEITKSLSISGDKIDYKRPEELVLQPSIIPITQPDVINLPDTKRKTRQDTKVKQLVDKITTPEVITQPITTTQSKLTTTTRTSLLNIPRAVKPVVLPFALPFPIRNKTKPSSSGYDVLVRKKGVFGKINIEPLSRPDALSLGSFRVGTTSSATFKLEKSAGSVAKYSGGRGNLQDFYRKNDLFIEKRGRRIKSLGELQEITYKGIATIKARNKSPFATKKKKGKKKKKGIWGF